MKVRCTQILCKQHLINQCSGQCLISSFFSLIHRTGEAVLLSARHLHHHLYYVVNSHSFLPISFFCKLSSLLLLALVISTGRSLCYFPFQYTVNQLQCFRFFIIILIQYGHNVLILSVLSLFKLEKRLLYQTTSLVSSGHGFNYLMLEIFFLYLVRLCFACFIGVNVLSILTYLISFWDT